MKDIERKTQNLIIHVADPTFDVTNYLNDPYVREALKKFISEMGFGEYSASIMTMMKMIGDERRKVNKSISGTYEKTIKDTEEGSPEITVTNQKKAAEIIKRHEKFEKKILKKAKVLYEVAKRMIDMTSHFIVSVDSELYKASPNHRFTRNTPEAKKAAFVEYVNLDQEKVIKEMRNHFKDLHSNKEKMRKGMPRL